MGKFDDYNESAETDLWEQLATKYASLPFRPPAMFTPPANYHSYYDKKTFKCDICDNTVTEHSSTQSFPFPIQTEVPIKMEVCLSCLSIMKRKPEPLNDGYILRNKLRVYLCHIKIWHLLTLFSGGVLWEAIRWLT